MYLLRDVLNLSYPSIGVKLIEKEVSTVAPVQVQKKFGALTLGDMIEIESEKSKKKK
jgi:hypothetical protein